jgi:phospholipid/cholesterol/gamma-HCH transport system substrate-binding protein
VVTVGALVAAVILVGILIFGGGGGYHYKLMFQTGGQLVNGNQVLIGGVPVGGVDSVSLTSDNQAEVQITVSQQLHEGTTAVIRTPSLSTVAGRYISLEPGPDNAPKLADDATLAANSTTTPVDLDQLFNTFNARTRGGLRQFIQGFATLYAGKGKQANATYKYFPPALSSTDRLLKELTSDQQVFTNFIVNTGKVVTAVAQKRDDLTSLVSNANTALGSIASQNAALDRTLQQLPPTLRQANTTFVNLRAALDDLDPLINTSKKATKNLAPFLRQLLPVLRRALPVFTDLRHTVDNNGNNDLEQLTLSGAQLHKLGSPASKTGVRAINASQPTIAFGRPYSPDLLGAITKLGTVSGYYDGNGKYARVQSAAFNLFNWNSVTSNLDPIPVSDKFNGFEFNPVPTRCPGSSTQAINGSNPFLDQGKLNGKCNPALVPPGP